MGAQITLRKNCYWSWARAGLPAGIWQMHVIYSICHIRYVLYVHHCIDTHAHTTHTRA